MVTQFEGLDEFDNEVYVLLEEGRKIGSIKVRLDLCTVMDIFVEEELRRKGWGTRFVRYVETLALQRGCKKMLVNAIKTEAKEFFEKCGYRLELDEYGEYFGERTLTE